VFVFPRGGLDVAGLRVGFVLVLALALALALAPVDLFAGLRVGFALALADLPSCPAASWSATALHRAGRGGDSRPAVTAPSLAWSRSTQTYGHYTLRVPGAGSRWHGARRCERHEMPEATRDVRGDTRCLWMRMTPRRRPARLSAGREGGNTGQHPS